MLFFRKTQVFLKLFFDFFSNLLILTEKNLSQFKSTRLQVLVAHCSSLITHRSTLIAHNS